MYRKLLLIAPGDVLKKRVVAWGVYALCSFNRDALPLQMI
ncbi:MAG: hypothetical protein JWP71_441 [Mucilaginibacter sp.]|nr:hypothetical protein [Mucilaginibacter sp.]